jgi:hypothetical protein
MVAINGPRIQTSLKMPWGMSGVNLENMGAAIQK